MKSETWWRIGVGALLFVGMFWMFYSELKVWQTAIAALLGFGGLIWAVTLSAKKQRDRDDRIRDQETQAMAKALRSEINSIVSLLRVKIKLVESDISESNDKNNVNEESIALSKFLVEWLSLTTPQVYLRCMEKIGFLPDPISKDVINFYDVFATTKNTIEAVIRLQGGGLNKAMAQDLMKGYKNLASVGEDSMESLNKFLN